MGATQCCLSKRKTKEPEDDFSGKRVRHHLHAKAENSSWVKGFSRSCKRGGKKASGTAKDEGVADQPGAEPQEEVGWVEQAFSGEVAVIVSDLSGFTKMTRKYGIQHFASIIVRKRQLCLPILDHYGAVHIGTEADNLIVVFQDVCNAAKAALEMQRVIRSYRDTLPEGREHFQIPLNGIGVHFAEGLLLDKWHGLHGEAFEFAYQIGEDCAEDGRVLVSNAVKERIEQEGFFAQSSFEPIEAEECELPLFSVDGDTGPLVGQQVRTDDNRFLKEDGLLLLAGRHDHDKDVEELDREIKEKCMSAYTVLMFNFDTRNAGSMQEQVVLKFQGIDLMKQVADRHNGDAVEEALWIFDQPLNAVLAALDLRKTIKDYNAEQAEDAKKLIVKGYGIHTGQLLFISGTDIHWGDPVNTSSKLGQDLAVGGDILVTPEAVAAAKQDERFPSMQVHLLPRKLYRSGVELPCSSVFDGSDSEAAAQACRYLLDSQVGDGALDAMSHSASLVEALDPAKLPPQLQHSLKLPAMLHLGIAAKQAKDAGGVTAPLTERLFDTPEVLERALRFVKFASAACLGGQEADLAARIPDLEAESVKLVQPADGACPFFFVADDPVSGSVVLCVQGAASAQEDAARLAGLEGSGGDPLRSFSGGRAPAALVDAADKVVTLSQPVLDSLLGADATGTSTRRLALVGHGFGAGVASLVALRALGALEGLQPPAWAARLLAPGAGEGAEGAGAGAAAASGAASAPAAPNTVDGFLLGTPGAPGAGAPRPLECFAFGPPPCFAPAAAALPPAVQECVFSFVNSFDCLPRSSPWAVAKLWERVVKADKGDAPLEQLLAKLTGEASQFPAPFPDPASEAQGLLQETQQLLGLNVVGSVVFTCEDTGFFAKGLTDLMGQEAPWRCERYPPELLEEVLLHPAMLKDHLVESYERSLAKIQQAGYFQAPSAPPAGDEAGVEHL